MFLYLLITKDMFNNQEYKMSIKQFKNMLKAFINIVKFEAMLEEYFWVDLDRVSTSLERLVEPIFDKEFWDALEESIAKMDKKDIRKPEYINRIVKDIIDQNPKMFLFLDKNLNEIIDTNTDR